MYRDYKVRLKMSMFRPIKQEDYIDVYENPYAMITYVALRIMGKDDMYIDAQPSSIWRRFAHKEPTKDNIKGIKSGLEILKEEGLIYYEDPNKRGGAYNININNLNIDKEDICTFTITSNEIMKLLPYNNSIKLIAFYLLLCSTINKKTKYGLTSQEQFSIISGYHRNTIARYFKIFDECDLIVFGETSYKNSDKGIESLPKPYTKIGMKQYLIDAEIKIQEKTKSTKQVEHYSKNENNNINISKRKDIVFR